VKRVIALMVVAGTLLAGCGDRPPLEDEPGWNCATQGNKICGELV
jgi:predicted small lipoprotein YifL